MYSLSSLGCKPRLMNPMIVSLLYKQYAQSIIRYLDSVDLTEKKLTEYDRKVFNEIKKDSEVYDKDNTFFSKKIKSVEEKLYINCLDYDPGTMIELVNSPFEWSNKGLVDSIKYFFI